MIAASAMMALAACGGGDNAPAPEERPATFTGQVRVTGNTPLEQVIIVPSDSAAAALEVRGALRPELRRLGGAEVRATGRVHGDRLFEVSRYEILLIAGQVPTVGLLEVASEDAVYVLRPAGDRVELRGAPSDLRAQSGAMVWVILDANGVVKGYGVIRER